MKYTSYISAPRWSNVKRGLYALAHEFCLDFNITDHDKGWIRETIYFEVEGEEKDVEEFEKYLNTIVKQHNRR